VLTRQEDGEKMALDGRKLKILEAIISNYLDTAEPVGSRTISRNYELNVSPATIRNEMSDLEELGLILQPHTSAGRIPSDKGYRLYVDMLMSAKNQDKRHNKHVKELVHRAGRIENLLQEIAGLIAKETNLMAVASGPQYIKCRVKNIQLIALEKKKVLTVIVTDGNVANNFVFEVSQEVDQKRLNKLSFILNHELHGLNVEEINLPLIESIKAYAGNQDEVIGKVLEVIFQSVKNEASTEIYTSGVLNMLRLPEFSNLEKATTIMETLEKKDKIRALLLSDYKEEDLVNDGIAIKIGAETGIKEMEDCSLIKIAYHIDGRPLGVIGVIGPKRMDYKNAIVSLKYLITQIEDRINNKEDG